MLSEKSEPPQAELRKLFRYDTSGKLIWRVDRCRTCKGQIAGNHAGTRGYTTIGVNNQRFYAARLIWVWWYGPIEPGLEIDHINRIRHDDRRENLRKVTRRENCCNTSRTINEYVILDRRPTALP